MTLKVYRELEQGTEEWLQARCGIATASVVGRLLTATGKVASNDQSRGLTHTLAAERITGHVDDTYVSFDMQRGTEQEPLARAEYEKSRGVDVEQVGFMTEDRWGVTIGYSPDGLVGDKGLIEIKSRVQRIQLQTIMAGEVPAANYTQLQAGLLVSGRDWIDYVSYSPGMPLFVRRVEPDEGWFSAIVDAVKQLDGNIQIIQDGYRYAVQGLPLTERIPTFEDITF